MALENLRFYADFKQQNPGGRIPQTPSFFLIFFKKKEAGMVREILQPQGIVYFFISYPE